MKSQHFDEAFDIDPREVVDFTTTILTSSIFCMNLDGKILLITPRNGSKQPISSLEHIKTGWLPSASSAKNGLSVLEAESRRGGAGAVVMRLMWGGALYGSACRGQTSAPRPCSPRSTMSLRTEMNMKMISFRRKDGDPKNEQKAQVISI